MADSEPVLTRRAEWSAYTASFFSVAILPMANLVVPLWALAIGATPLEIGIVMGARSLMPFLFAIHGGAVIDRLGTRRVMAFSASFAAVLVLAYPMLPWVGALIALQVMIGMITTMGWIGAQTHIAQLARGAPVYMGRFTSVSTLSNFIGPLIAGMAWDRFGAWGAFGMISLWGAVMWLSVRMLPPSTPKTPSQQTADGVSPGGIARTLLPDARDYGAALRLLLTPAIAVVVACSFLMNAALSMRFAFYVVYLESVGMTGAVIGFLVGLSSLVGAIVALATGPASRIMPQHWLAILSILVAIAGVTATPLASEFLSLFLLACLFGMGNGLGFAQIISILSRVVPVGQLGVGIGLRTTVNRLASLCIPVLMGAVIQNRDLAASFYVVGAVLAVATILVALVVWRTTGAKNSN